MKYIPDWFPGTGFKRVAKDWRGVLDQTVDQPHAFVKQQMVSCFESTSKLMKILIYSKSSGHYFPSFTSAFLEDGPKSEDDDYTLKWAGFALYGGGADTVSSICANLLRSLLLIVLP